MTWLDINRRYGTMAPSFLKLIDLVLTIPATSVEAERGFSTLKLTKTDQRNSLKSISLNNLLRIKLLSAPEDGFDPTPAVDHWASACVRRTRNRPQQLAADDHETAEDGDEMEAGPSGIETDDVQKMPLPNPESEPEPDDDQIEDDDQIDKEEDQEIDVEESDDADTCESDLDNYGEEDYADDESDIDLEVEIRRGKEDFWQF